MQSECYNETKNENSLSWVFPLKKRQIKALLSYLPSRATGSFRHYRPGTGKIPTAKVVVTNKARGIPVDQQGFLKIDGFQKRIAKSFKKAGVGD